MRIVAAIEAIVAIAAIAACAQSDAVPCGDELCPRGNQCIDGSCIAPGEACGNGHTDLALDEVCDDGNTADGDGCSADCLSDESCGNGTIDPLAAVPEACECDGADCRVPGEMCADYGFAFGQLTCGAAGDPSACQLAFDACETFGWRQRAATDTIRARPHGTDVVALDVLGRLAIYATEVPRPIAPVAPGVTINDFALLGETLYAAASDQRVYRRPVDPAAAWEKALFETSEREIRIEAMDAGAGVVDLILVSDRTAVHVWRDTDVGFELRGTNAYSGEVSAAGGYAYLLSDNGNTLAAYDPLLSEPWQPIQLDPAVRPIVDAARILGFHWVTTALGDVAQVSPSGPAAFLPQPSFGESGGVRRFLAGPAIVVHDGTTIAVWNGAAWQRLEPPLFAPIRTADASGGLQVAVDERGLQVRQPRAWYSPSDELAPATDATASADTLYLSVGTVALVYDGLTMIPATFPTLTLLGNLACGNPVGVQLSACTASDGGSVGASNREITYCAGPGCTQATCAPMNHELELVRCGSAARTAWVVTRNPVLTERQLHRFATSSGVFDGAPVIADADAIGDVATVRRGTAADELAIAVGRDGGAAVAWTITGSSAVVATPYPELAELASIAPCADDGTWIAGGLTAEGSAAVLRHRLGGDDVIVLPPEQTVVAVAGTCDAFYAATPTELIYWSDGVAIPMRWPFLHGIRALMVDDRGTSEPRDDEVIVAASGGFHHLR